MRAFPAAKGRSMGIVELLLVFTLIAVVVFLVSGMVSFASGDEALHAKSNLLMRLRVISQGLAIALLALLVYFSR
jgi:hypothetical protein